MNSIFAPADELRENRVFQRAKPSGHEKSILAQTAERTPWETRTSFFYERHFVKSGLSEMEILIVVRLRVLLMRESRVALTVFLP